MGENHPALHCHDLLEAVQGNLTAVLPGEVQQQRGEHLVKNTRTCRRGAGQMKIEYVIIVLCPCTSVEEEKPLVAQCYTELCTRYTPSILKYAASILTRYTARYTD